MTEDTINDEQYITAQAVAKAPVGDAIGGTLRPGYFSVSEMPAVALKVASHCPVQPTATMAPPLPGAVIRQNGSECERVSGVSTSGTCSAKYSRIAES